MPKTAVTHRKSFGFIFHEYIMRTNLFLVLLGFFMHHVHNFYIMQVYIYTSPQCQAAKVSQLPERDAGKRQLVTTLAQQHLKVQEYRIDIGQNYHAKNAIYILNAIHLTQ